MAVTHMLDRNTNPKTHVQTATQPPCNSHNDCRPGQAARQLSKGVSEVGSESTSTMHNCGTCPRQIRTSSKVLHEVDQLILEQACLHAGCTDLSATAPYIVSGTSGPRHLIISPSSRAGHPLALSGGASCMTWWTLHPKTDCVGK